MQGKASINDYFHLLSLSVINKFHKKLFDPMISYEDFRAGRKNHVFIQILMILLFATGRIAEAETLYKQISEIGYKPDNSAIASMITLYGRFHQLKQAQEAFASISHSSNSVDAAYNSMIDVYCKSGEITAATQLFEEMISKGYTQDAVTISILVNTCTKNG